MAYTQLERALATLKDTAESHRTAYATGAGTAEISISALSPRRQALENALEELRVEILTDVCPRCGTIETDGAVCDCGD